MCRVEKCCFGFMCYKSNKKNVLTSFNVENIIAHHEFTHNFIFKRYNEDMLFKKKKKIVINNSITLIPRDRSYFPAKCVFELS